MIVMPIVAITEVWSEDNTRVNFGGKSSVTKRLVISKTLLLSNACG